MIKKILKKTISDFLMKTNHKFIVRDVMNFFNKELSKALHEYFITNFIKNQMRLTNKKVKSRSNNINYDI